MEFNEIYRNYWPKVFRLCMGFVNDRDWAKDIAQDTFVTVWQKLPQVRNEAFTGTWIYRIATNKCLRQIEKENRYTRSDLKFDMPEPVTTDIEDHTAFLYRCISELPEIERIIISMELEDLKQAEIASIVGIS